MKQEDLEAFEILAKNLYPKLEIRYKDEAWTQKVIGFLAKPFNPDYMTKFVSTFAPYVYFPSRAWYARNPTQSISILAHELVHLLDSQRQPIWFRLSYLFPQVLAVPVLALFVALAGKMSLLVLAGLIISLLTCSIMRLISQPASMISGLVALVGTGVSSVMLTGWTSIVFFLALTCLAPWPAPMRVMWEKRGYRMNFICSHEMTSNLFPQVQLAIVVRYFVTSLYYWMSWDTKGMNLWAATEQSNAGKQELEAPYRDVQQWIRSRKA